MSKLYKTLFLLLTGIALLFSCKSTEPVEDTSTVEPAGFLTSYKNMKKDKKDQLSKRSVSKNAHRNKMKTQKFSPNFRSYDELEKGDIEQLNQRYVYKNKEWHEYKQIKINPVQVWTKDGSKLNEIDKKELKNLLDYIHAQATEGLSDYFDLTDQNGPHVLNLTIALSDGDASCKALETESSLNSLGLASAFVKKSSPNLHRLINNASVEIKVEDVISQKLFFAGIDPIMNKENTWNSTKENFDFWSIRLRKELLNCGAGN